MNLNVSTGRRHPQQHQVLSMLNQRLVNGAKSHRSVHKDTQIKSSHNNLQTTDVTQISDGHHKTKLSTKSISNRNKQLGDKSVRNKQYSKGQPASSVDWIRSTFEPILYCFGGKSVDSLAETPFELLEELFGRIERTNRQSISSKAQKPETLELERCLHGIISQFKSHLKTWLCRMIDSLVEHTSKMKGLVSACQQRYTFSTTEIKPDQKGFAQMEALQGRIAELTLRNTNSMSLINTLSRQIDIEKEVMSTVIINQSDSQFASDRGHREPSTNFTHKVTKGQNKVKIYDL